MLHPNYNQDTHEDCFLQVRIRRWSIKKNSITDITYITVGSDADRTDYDYSIFTLDDSEIVRSRIDKETGDVLETSYPDEELKQAGLRTASSGYWDDVKDCIMSEWKTPDQIPNVVKIVCGANCVACLTFQSQSCPVCIACAAGYAISCSLWQLE